MFSSDDKDSTRVREILKNNENKFNSHQKLIGRISK